MTRQCAREDTFNGRGGGNGGLSFHTYTQSSIFMTSKGTHISGVSGVNSCLCLNTVSVTIYINSSPLTAEKISSLLAGETNHEDRTHGPTSVRSSPSTLISLQLPKGCSFVTPGPTWEGSWEYKWVCWDLVLKENLMAETQGLRNPFSQNLP